MTLKNMIYDDTTKVLLCFRYQFVCSHVLFDYEISVDEKDMACYLSVV